MRSFFAILFLLVLTLALSTRAVHALDGRTNPLDPALLDAAANAATELILRINNSVGTAPRISDPEIAYLVSVAFSEEIAKSELIESDTIARIAGLQVNARAVVRAYLVYGNKRTDSKNDADRLRRTGENLLRYLVELAPAYDFSLRTGAQIARFAAQSASSAQERKWRQAVAAEQFLIVSSVLACASDTSIEADWRAARLEILIETAPDFSRILNRKDALLLADRALVAAKNESDSNLSSELKRFALAIGR